ncbi:MAG: 23S rRNA (adenine(2503)-C(2))-methyltransferase RlmN [Lachnospiraceae bacterium]|jgi:23S rRNA (adenine2503-C2)-methyltransferase|nr:23S rRNA (adenine(2503)-C(2))-methyltransferase RlmN [Lachnospiraceae bacterium]
MKKTDIKSLSLPQLVREMEQIGEKKFRAAQLYEWMHKKLAEDFAEMTNLSLSLREKCAEHFELTVLHAVQVQESKQDGTKKFLFELPDGNMVESVLMRYHHGNSVCISSQVGCKMGCKFCASTLGGLERSLTAAEMLEQVYAVTRKTGDRVSNVVVMGIGEPLDNMENLIRFIRMLTDEKGLHISQRNITVSTCGLVPKIKELAEEDLQVTLALSLHGATDEKRRELMPVAEKYSIAELMEACRYYFEKTGRRITFEYALAGGVNDTEEDAAGLIRLAFSVHAHVNLIPINPVRERKYTASGREAVKAFQRKLEEAGINATLRREMGRDIDGACGQLRRNHHKKK